MQTHRPKPWPDLHKLLKNKCPNQEVYPHTWRVIISLQINPRPICRRGKWGGARRSAHPVEPPAAHNISVIVHPRQVVKKATETRINLCQQKKELIQSERKEKPNAMDGIWYLWVCLPLLERCIDHCPNKQDWKHTRIILGRYYTYSRVIWE